MTGQDGDVGLGVTIPLGAGISRTLPCDGLAPS